jgi:hypothetical protein
MDEGDDWHRGEPSGAFSTGFTALACAGYLLFSAVRGLIAYASGVRASWSDPGLCVFALVAGGWMLSIGVRIGWQAWTDSSARLLRRRDLLALSVICLVGATWSGTFHATAGFLGAAASVSLFIWWMIVERRHRGSAA